MLVALVGWVVAVLGIFAFVVDLAVVAAWRGIGALAQPMWRRELVDVCARPEYGLSKMVWMGWALVPSFEPLLLVVSLVTNVCVLLLGSTTVAVWATCRSVAV